MFQATRAENELLRKQADGRRSTGCIWNCVKADAAEQTDQMLRNKIPRANKAAQVAGTMGSNLLEKIIRSSVGEEDDNLLEVMMTISNATTIRVEPFLSSILVL
ncbi:hypothetical protein Tco_1093215 [Tanacetum coccineum]|uniref:Uncharacterized protein n=1 Tax=Tanacetum coccineum TaxID=301880 RepID=A0ABQ5IC17_9ASTR